jgi:hypothetical protein
MAHRRRARWQLVAANDGSLKDTWDNRVALLERYEREAHERKAEKFAVALSATCAVVLLIILAVCFAGKLPHIPWQALCSGGGLVSAILWPLWQAYFAEVRSAKACQRKLHEQVCSNQFSERANRNRSGKGGRPASAPRLPP